MGAGGSIFREIVKILHVHTNTEVPKQLNEVLESREKSFEIIAETHPEDALAALRTTEFECLVSGYDLPEMNGTELIDAVRENDDVLPVILFPEDGNEEVASRAISAGVTDYIPNDSGQDSIDSLADRIQELVDSGRTISETNSRYDRDQFKRFLEAFPDAVFVMDEEGRYLDYITGGDRSLLYDDINELLGHRYHEVLPAETADRFLETIRQALETGDQQQIEYQLDVKKGQRWFEARVGPLDTQREPRTVFWIARDITERKQREREYEQIFHGVNDIITIHDPRTAELIDVNDTFCELLGYDREEILDMGITGYSPVEEGYTMEQAQAFVEEVIDTDGSKQTEWAVETRSGEIRWLDVEGTTVEIGGDIQYVSISRDITERLRREREYEQIFDNVNDIIAVRDPETGELIDANQAYADLLGYEREEMQGMTIGDTGVPEEGYDEEQGMDHLRDVVASDEPVEFEWKVQGADGQTYLMDVRGTAARINGEHRYLAIGRDITERKRREQRLEVFNRILRHNLRNQLDVISCHAEALSDQSTEEHAERIIAAVDQLAAIGARARKIDRVMSMENEYGKIRIDETLREVVASIDANWNNIEVTTEFPTKRHLTTNEQAVTIAVESALENAIEHAESAVTVGLEDSPDGCTIRVEDDGPGMPEDELVPIETRTETNLRHGKGLGLWQLRWSVDLLNGTLSFDTTDGTTVRITIPDQAESRRME